MLRIAGDGEGKEKHRSTAVTDETEISLTVEEGRRRRRSVIQW